MTTADKLTATQAVEISAFPTSVLSDALDELSISGVIVGPQAQRNDQGRIVGQALPVRFEPHSLDPDAYRFGGGVGKPLEQVLKRMQHGDVVVMDLGGTLRASAWGSLASQIAQFRGVRGTVLLGTCRDVAEIREIGYPVWALGVCPRRSRNEFTFGSIGEPINLGGVTVETGDVIVADQTGVVRVPWSDLERVLDLARGIMSQESGLLAQVLENHVVAWDQV